MNVKSSPIGAPPDCRRRASAEPASARRRNPARLPEQLAGDSRKTCLRAGAMCERIVAETMNHTVAAQRLHNQYVIRAGPRDPARLVAWLGVVQSQEFGPAKWGLGLRMPAGITDARIQRAFDAGRIL